MHQALMKDVEHNSLSQLLAACILTYPWVVLLSQPAAELGPCQLAAQALYFRDAALSYAELIQRAIYCT